jgi:hypothetical protein
MEAIALMDYLQASRLERENVMQSRIASKTMRFLKISSLLVTQSLSKTHDLIPWQRLGK